MGTKPKKTGRAYIFYIACVVMAPVLVCGCSRFQTGSTFKEANELFGQGDYEASLKTYEGIIERHPSAGDRVLFEMGIIYSYPRNEQKDYRKSLECFQELIKNYPESSYRYDSERMIFHIQNVVLKDQRIAEQQTLMETLQQELESKGNEIAALREEIEELHRKVSSLEPGPADKILIEKKERRLSLMAKGSVFRTYKIALGGNPNGPKVRQGDNKTPEGTYIIDSRNMDSRYHISLHISYPNERDKQRAKKLGVLPGGDIMIHGIKNGFSMVGGLHAGSDWTKGCIAVTDEEIEEIEMLAPNGTIVEIRP